MEKIESVQQLKLTFLELWKDISDEETQLLLNYEHLDALKNRFMQASSDDFSIDKILLTFHAYASIAYLSAELIVNAKIYLDNAKNNYILLARKHIDDIFQFCIVYSNVKALSSHPGIGIPIDNMIGYLESQNSIDELTNFYSTHTK